MFPSNNLDSFLEKYLEELSQNNWTQIPIDPEFVKKLYGSAKKKLAQNLFKIAGVSQSITPQTDIRNDSIYWLDASSDDLGQIDIMVLMHLDNLKDHLRSFFRISISEFECHYAVYKPGQFYKRHTDTTSINNKRVFSFVIYLNEVWGEEDGGQIVGYQDDKTLFNVLPLSGNILIFKSDIEHEVLPTQKNRYSLTGWYRR